MANKGIILLVTILLSVSICYAAPVLWTTDAYGNPKLDFSPGSIVYIHGTGFDANVLIDIDITRPDSAIESCNGSYCNPRFNSGVQQSTDAEGDLVYEYDLN